MPAKHIDFADPDPWKATESNKFKNKMNKA
jgi:hypothetical protein